MNDTRFKNYKPRVTARPASVDQILSAALRRRGLDKKIDQYRFVTNWEAIVGEVIAAKTKPQCIRNKALVVEVVSSTWAQELSFHKETILKKLAPYLSEGQVVEDVRFAVKN
jgi:predicted nucleic acid-binding Zn ribbon protein